MTALPLDGSERERAEIDSTVAARLESALLTMLLALPFAAIAAWRFELVPRRWLVMAVAVHGASLGVALHTAARFPRATALGLVAVLCATAAVFCSAEGATGLLPLVLATMSIGVATVLPWGLACQLATAIMATAAILASAWFSTAGLTAIATTATASAALAIAASLCIAYQVSRRFQSVAAGDRPRSIGPRQNQGPEQIPSSHQRHQRRETFGAAEPALDPSAAMSSDLEQLRFDLRELLRPLVHELGACAAEKNLQLGFDVEKEVPEALVGNPARLRQVLLNVLANAINTAQGDIILHVARNSIAPGEICLRFAICHSGPGLPPEAVRFIEAAFDPVHPSSAHPAMEGAAMHLAESAELIRKMGGRMWAESQPEQGTLLRFTARFGRTPNRSNVIDLERHRIDGAAASSGDSLPALAAPLDARPLHILVVEDNLVNQHLAQRLLEKNGHSVIVANDGREAIAAVEKENFDLVFMDIQMPEMDGLRATALIRHREKTTGGHVPIVAMTAHALEYEEQRCLRAGMDGFLPKPVRREALFAVIDAVRETKRPSRNGNGHSAGPLS